jgi:hypothetical protein
MQLDEVVVRAGRYAMWLAAAATLALGVGVTARAGSSSDQQLAARMTLQLSDFDSGFTQFGKAGNGIAGGAVGPCGPASVTPSAHSFSAQFQNFPLSQVQAQNVVDVFPDASTAQQEYADLADQDAACEASLMGSLAQLPGSLAQSPATISPLNFTPSCAATACDYEVTARRVSSEVQPASGPPGQLTADLVVALRGRAVVTFIFSSSVFSSWTPSTGAVNPPLPGVTSFTNGEERAVEGAMSRGYDGAPTKATWAAAANAICARANLQISELPMVTSRPVAVADERAIVRIVAQSDTQTAAIPRPAAEEALIDALLASDSKGRALMQKAIVALRDPHPTRSVGAAYARIGQEIETLNASYNATARSLGARICALNPRPGGSGTIH